MHDLLREKGSAVLSIGKDATVLQAAVMMNDHKVGALVVIDRGQVVGMFSERDVLRRVVSEARDPSSTRVEDVMTTEVVVATPQTTLEEAKGVMKNRRIRHLPVCCDQSGNLMGVVSIGDLNAYNSTAQERTIHFMTEYIYGRV